MASIDPRERERRRRAKSAAAQPKPVAKPASDRPKSEAELFDGLRQGARNVAGVRWQIAVSVHLLVASYAGDLPFVLLTPEGLEDLDGRTASGDRIFIQMKEMGGGVGRFTATDLASALMHWEQIPSAARFAVLTDAELGSGLFDTGWSGTVSDQSGKPVEDVRGHLINAGLSAQRAADLLARAHLIRLPWNMRGETEARLIRSGVPPAVAGLAVGTLYDEMGQSSADQRTRTLATARTHAPSDVDRVVIDVQSSVDVSGLDAAVAQGVCAPADYVHPNSISARQFYAGVDGSPGYIAAGLDVVRVSEMAQITSAVEQDRYALIVGPSGSGKSMLLWRAARDVIAGARIVRVRRASTPAEADLLVRHVKLLRPSTASKIVIAGDDLGRPHMSAWGEAVDALRELNDVFIIGACREEDFDPSLVRRGAAMVQPRLDEDTARRMAAQIAAAGLSTAMDPSEAWSRSDGLLMEFIALLTQAKRLEHVLAEQAAALRRPGRELQRAAARLVTAAHSVGLALTADQLGSALAATGPSIDLIGDALEVLRGEHVVVSDGITWHGLHELRSQVLSAALHQSPPPTIVTTWETIALVLPPSEAGWLLRRVAEQRPEATVGVASALAPIAADPSRKPGEVAQLLEGAERADNLIYARLALPILEAGARGAMSVRQLQGLAYSIRHQGMRLSQTGDSSMNAAFRHLELVAASLPARASAALDAAASQLTGDGIRQLLASASLADATRVLESCVGVVTFDAHDVPAVLAQLPLPTNVRDAAMFGRVIEALATSIGSGAAVGAFGETAGRAAAVLRVDPTVVGLEVHEEADGLVITCTTMLPPHEGDDPTPEWDVPPADSRGNDHANRHAVAIARRIASACPETDFVEIITVTPSGRRFTIAGSDGWEPGHKRLSRDAFPSRVDVRRNVGFQAAMTRLAAASTWSALLNEQVETARELTKLISEAPARLRDHDKPSQRNGWANRVKKVNTRAHLLAGRPVALQSDLATTHAGADAAERRDDPISEGLRDIASRLPAILQGNLAGTASLLRDARGKLIAAQDSGEPVLGLGASFVRPASSDLLDGIERLAEVLLAVHGNPAVAQLVDTRDLQTTVDKILHDASTAAAGEQLAILESVTDGIPIVAIHHVVDPMPFPNAIMPRAWLVTVHLNDWNALVEALRTLTHDQRWRIKANVIAAVMEDDEVLPLAIKIAHTGDIPEFPITAEDLRPFVQSAGLHFRPGSSAYTRLNGIVDALTALSWEASRRRARPTDWPDIPGVATRTTADLRAAAHPVTEQLPLEVREAVRAAIDLLISQVEAELSDAGTSISLAAEMFENALADSYEGPAEALWDALAIVSSVSAFG